MQLIGSRRRWRRCLVARVLACVLALTVVTVPLARPVHAAATKQDSREKKARRAFAVGRFAEALDLFGALYADTLHPTYLRNIGRCYQNLDQPDKAITSFKDYLRLAKGLTVAEKAEIDGYIAEMEALKRKQDMAAASSLEAARPAPTPIPAAAPPQPELAPESMVLTSPQPAPQPQEQASPFYKRGWFWGVVAGVVVVGVVSTLAATGAFSSSDPCSGRVCVNLGER